MGIYQTVRQLLNEKKYREAAALSGAFLAARPSDLALWHLTAQAVLGMGDCACAVGNLRSIAEAAADRGKPILALGILSELEGLGEDPSDLIDKTAALYCKDAGRLVEMAPSPPPIRMEGDTAPWQDDANLLTNAKNAMAAAWGDLLISEGRTAALPYLPIFSALSSDNFKLFVNLMIRCEFDKGDTVIEQESAGDAMYIIIEGEAAVLRRQPSGEETVLAKLGPGAFFGEMALVSSAKRAAAVVAEERTVLLRANKTDIHHLVEKAPEFGDVLLAFCHQRMLQNLMRISTVLAPVPPAKRPEVIGAFTTDYRKKGNILIAEGERGPGLFLIVSGQAAVEKQEGNKRRTLAILGPGDVFGEISLLMNKPAGATVIALENTALLFLAAEDFMVLTQDYPQLLKGAFDIALKREFENTSILAGAGERVDDLILV